MILTEYLSEIFSAWSVLLSNLYVHRASHEISMHVSGIKTLILPVPQLGLISFVHCK